MMGFFDTLRRVMGAGAPGPAASDIAAAWGLTEDGADAGPTRPGDLTATAASYDQTQWLKKMKRILGELPASQSEWAELLTEARALKLDPEWVRQSELSEFQLLVRRAVADRHLSETDHRKLDLARDLIGIPEAEAEATLHAIVAEAESFFNRSVQND